MEKIAIVSALGREIKYVKDRIHLEKSFTINGYRFSYGSYKGREIILAISSVGKVNAALASQILISQLKVSSIINLGIAGALSKDVGLLDIVLARETAYHDLAQYILSGTYPYQSNFKSDPLLLAWAEKAAESWQGQEILHFGQIITGDSFIDSKEEKARLRSSFKPLCVDMEGAAIAHACYINEIPYIGIRAISDLADSSARENYQDNELLASEKAGKFLLHLLDNPV